MSSLNGHISSVVVLREVKFGNVIVKCEVTFCYIVGADGGVFHQQSQLQDPIQHLAYRVLVFYTNMMSVLMMNARTQHKKKPVTTMLTYPWKCTVLHCNHLGNTWKPLVLMTWHFDYCLSASDDDNQSVRSSAPVVSRCFPGGYNVKLYISRGRLAWWLLAFLHSGSY